MRRNPFGDVGSRCGLLDRALDMGLVKVIASLFPSRSFGMNVRVGAGKNHCQMSSLAAFLYFSFGLTNQMRRAAVSISSNLAEGCSRSSKVDYARLVELATGSVFEVVSQATIGRHQGFLNQGEYEQVYDAAEKQSRMLSGLRKSLRVA
jgi:four helix bundle protein